MRVTFRAEFRGYKVGGPLNPGQLNWPNPQPVMVEVFRRGTHWFARPAAAKGEFRLESAPTHGVMKDIVADAFDRQLSEWSLFDSTGNPLDPDRVEEDPAGNFTLKPLTHVARPDQNGVESNSYVTVCGEKVSVHQIRSLRAKQKPACPICRKAWEHAQTQERIG
jgi:hypothetical protein